MEITHLTPEGHVLIPKPIRDAHHWPAGTEFVVEEQNGGIVLRPKMEKPFPVTDLLQGLGCVGYRGPTMSDADIAAALADDVRRRWQSE